MEALQSKKPRRRLGREVYSISVESGAEMVKNAMNAGIICWHQFGHWGNRKKVSEAYQEEKFGQDASAVRASQDLVSRKEWNEVVRPMAQAKSWLRSCISKPWLHHGVDFIDVDDIEKVDEYFREKRVEVFDAFDRVFAPEYSKLKGEFAINHPELFNEANYPSLYYLRDSLRFEWGFTDVRPPIEEKAVETRGITAEMVRRQRLMWEEQCKESMRKGVDIAKAGLAKLFSNLRDVLADPSKKFQDTTVEKPKELLARLKDVELWGDEPFKELIEDAEEVLGGVYAEDLRDDEAYRKVIGGAVGDIVDEFKKLPVVEMDRAIDF